MWVWVQVKTAEGFSKRELFEKLAPLEEATRPIMAEARTTLGHKKGQSALQPWNISYSLSGALPCKATVPSHGTSVEASAMPVWSFVHVRHDIVSACLLAVGKR